MTKWDRFDKDIFLMFISNFLFCLGLNLYSSFIPIHIKDIGGDEYVISLVVALPFIFFILSVPVGILCDIVDRKYLILFSWFITLPAPLIWYFTNTWQWFVFGQFIYSFTSACLPAVLIYIFDYKTEKNKMKAFSFFIISITISSIIAPSIGGFLIDEYGIKTVFMIVFFIFLIASLIISGISNQKVDNKIKIRDALNLKSLKEEYDLKHIAHLIIILCIIIFSMNIAEPYIAVYLETIKGLDIKEIGISFMIFFFGVTFFSLLFGKIDGMFSFISNTKIGLVIFVSGIVILLFSKNIVTVFIALFFISINRSIILYFQGMFTSVLRGSKKGLIGSTFIGIGGITTSVAMLVGAPLYKASSTLVFLAEIVLIIVLILVLSVTGFSKKIATKDAIIINIKKNNG